MTKRKRLMKRKSRRVKKGLRRSRRYGGTMTEEEASAVFQNNFNFQKFKVNDIVEYIKLPGVKYKIKRYFFDPNQSLVEDKKQYLIEFIDFTSVEDEFKNEVDDLLSTLIDYYKTGRKGRNKRVKENELKLYDIDDSSPETLDSLKERIKEQNNKYMEDIDNFETLIIKYHNELELITHLYNVLQYLYRNHENFEYLDSNSIENSVKNYYKDKDTNTNPEDFKNIVSLETLSNIMFDAIKTKKNDQVRTILRKYHTRKDLLNHILHAIKNTNEELYDRVIDSNNSTNTEKEIYDIVKKLNNVKE